MQCNIWVGESRKKTFLKKGEKRREKHKNVEGPKETMLTLIFLTKPILISCEFTKLMC